MIVMNHSPDRLGWKYHAAAANLHGGGRTLDECIDTSEHAARYYLTQLRGYPVRHEDARHSVRHRISRTPVIDAHQSASNGDGVAKAASTVGGAGTAA
jgi:hypothetical protein